MRRTYSHYLCAGIAFVAVSLMGAASQAQVPISVPFSGSLSTSSGPVDGNVSVVFRLFNAATNGNEVWTETHNLSVAGGLVLTELGSAGTPLDASVFDGTPLWLEVEIDTEVLSPRSAIGAVPYAMRADEASYAATAGDSDRFGGQLPASFQTRVSQVCSAGSSIRQIAANGSVICEAIPTVYATNPGIRRLSGNQLQAYGIDRFHIEGTEVALYEAAAGCGGGLTTATSCKTDFCNYDGVNRYHFDCLGNCLPFSARQTCNNLTRVGWMLAPNIP